jgi:hypothetical protein
MSQSTEKANSITVSSIADSTAKDPADADDTSTGSRFDKTARRKVFGTISDTYDRSWRPSTVTGLVTKTAVWVCCVAGCVGTCLCVYGDDTEQSHNQGPDESRGGNIEGGQMSSREDTKMEYGTTQ